MWINTFPLGLVFWLGLIGFLAFVYALPVIIGLIRNVECLGLVVIANVIPIGWLGALIAACMLPRKEPVKVCPPPYHEPHW